MTTLSSNGTTDSSVTGFVTSLPVTGSSPLHVGDLVTAPIKAMIVKYTYVSVGAVGCVGNFIVIFILAFYTNVTQKTANLLVINQSAIDMTAAVMMILTSLLNVNSTGMNRDSVYDQFVCRIWLTNLPLWSMLVSSTYSILLMSLERYVAILYPAFYKMKVKRSIIYVAMIISFNFGAIFEFPLNIGTADIVDGVCLSGGVWPNDISRRVTGVFVFVVCYLLPVLVNGFCYGRIYNVLRTKVKPGDVATSPATYTVAKRNVLKTLFTVFGCFVLCFSCNEIIFFLYHLGMELDFSGAMYHFSIIAAFANCCVNPIIYVVNYNEFRNGFNLFRSQVIGGGTLTEIFRLRHSKTKS